MTVLLINSSVRLERNRGLINIFGGRKINQVYVYMDKYNLFIHLVEELGVYSNLAIQCVVIHFTMFKIFRFKFIIKI